MADTNRLYRFRSIKNLLRKHELANLEIYFAKSSELNDPMEGYQDTYWQGDSILWENLFRNYLLCLEWAFALLVHKPGESISWREVINAPYHDDQGILSDKERRELERLVNRFLDNETIQTLIRTLSSDARPVRRAELYCYLYGVHSYAISLLFDLYEQRGLLTHTAREDWQTRAARGLEGLSGLFTAMNSMTSSPTNGMNRDAALNVMFDGIASIFLRADLHFRYNGEFPVNDPGKMTAFINFPHEYAYFGAS